MHGGTDSRSWKERNRLAEGKHVTASRRVRLPRVAYTRTDKFLYSNPDTPLPFVSLFGSSKVGRIAEMLKKVGDSSERSETRVPLQS